MTDLRLVDSLDSGIREYYLTHGALAQQPTRAGDNQSLFVHDLIDGRFLGYRGSYVAYQKGVLCGQSVDGETLFDCTGRYYGISSLGVFKVPSRTEKVGEFCAVFGK